MSDDFEDKIVRIERRKDKNRVKKKNSEDRDAYQRVFDARTINLLQKLLNNQIIKEIVGTISQGKEANVYFAYGKKKKPLAIKIYKIDIQSARWMKNYIIGDPRFKKTGKSPDKVIFTWCQKEYKNLTQMYKVGLICPEPIYFKANILIMSYIGYNNGTPAKKLKDCIQDNNNPIKEYNVSIQFIKDLYHKAKLVHADLSEYNILYHEKKQFFIDVSQSVSINHPKALTFLIRDIKNINKFYNNSNVLTTDLEKIYYEIVESVN